MNLNQYTTKSQEAIQKAQQIALDFGHQSIEPQHLLEGILQVDENISAFLMKKSEADLNLIREKNREALEKLPKVEGGNIYLSQSANKILLDGVLKLYLDLKIHKLIHHEINPHLLS